MDVRQCGKCSNLRYDDDSCESYWCSADREMVIRKPCDQYFPKNVDVLLVSATKDQSPLVSKKYEDEIGSMKRLNEFSFVAKNGDLYVTSWAEEANLRGRKAKEVWVDGKLPFGKLISTIASIVNNDMTHIRTF